ncbi:aminotransferase class V-fold PLP-dependent enzyme [Pimelobacter sp. 30-1]|uniref:aminotransferase class V-fold PLP-dependent enzyme n=1 Tax=Pimelobacter sp. 30-1 TaxID=2004991 RepID=UPI001C05D9C2|nr:aminotransferase class V-fold PLP-dependent enzyme [Pimelobacter sp. 30-1]MBU2698817.1 hypothetical protein [Pimelobacter sp. 30-1]
MNKFTGLYRDLYPGADDAVYLDVAAVGLISARVAEAVSRFAQGHLLRGIADDRSREVEMLAARQAVAALVGSSPDRISFTQNTSTGLALVVNGIDWVEGDNIVVPAGEFPSNFYPWTQLRSRGVELREVAMVEGHAPIDAIARATDPRTRVVALSAVQYSSGHRNDLAGVSQAAAPHGALVVVDGTQAVGAMRLDCDALGIDVLAVSAHKWMLGPLGIGFTAMSSRAMHLLRPSTVGWMSVEEPFAFTHEPQLANDGRRFESGTANIAGIAGLRQAATQVLELTPDVVEQHILDCTEELEASLVARGWRSLRSADRRRWSGILIATNNEDTQDVHNRLVEAGVRCSLRGGGIRFSPHYYTGSADLEAVLSVLT